MKINFGVNLLPHLVGKGDIVATYGLANEGDHTVVNQESKDIRIMVGELEKLQTDYAADIPKAKEASKKDLGKPSDMTKPSPEAVHEAAVVRRDLEFRLAIKTIKSKLPPIREE